jgi:hypothetical protein
VYGDAVEKQEKEGETDKEEELRGTDDDNLLIAAANDCEEENEDASRQPSTEKEKEKEEEGCLAVDPDEPSGEEEEKVANLAEEVAEPIRTPTPEEMNSFFYDG